MSVLTRAFAERWLDWYPAEGKRSGAYSNGGAYDVHPYILLNYLGQYNDVSTLAHELGHTMHSYYSNRTQPYATADYSTFVAEVASTFNEALLIDYMLKQIKDKPTRLSLLGSYLENIKATVFRQTQFAEFEMRMHERGLKSEPITGDALATLYFDITARYYGHQQKLVVVDDYVANEWSYIPHFYSDFYVFQYATSFTAAEALAARVHRRRRGRHRPLSDIPRVGKLPVPDRSAQGRRRRHDDRRAARSDDADDESGDGRDGRDSRVEADSRWPRQGRPLRRTRTGGRDLTNAMLERRHPRLQIAPVVRAALKFRKVRIVNNASI